MKTMLLVMTIFVVWPFLSGCRGLYDGVRMQSLERCYHRSYPEQVECLRENDVGYEQYQEERRQRRQGDDNARIPQNDPPLTGNE